MKKDILNKMSAEALSQMAANGDISDNFSPSLKARFLKIGSVSVLAGLLSISSGLVQADNGTRNGAITLSGLFGLLTSGSKPNDIPVDCNIQGTSGLKVGGAGALGAYAGSHIGGGSGKQIATIAGGVIAAATAQGIENERMRADCARQIEQSNRNHNGIPGYATNSSSPQSAILYEGRTISGKAFYVTAKDSPGLAGLGGQVIGSLDVENDPIVKSAMEKGSALLGMSHENLDIRAQEYLKVMNGGTTVAKLSRYAVDDNDVASNSPLNKEQQMRMLLAKKNFEEAYSEYSRRRSVFANVSDNAVVDGYNISKYGQALSYFIPPESATVTYSGKLPNRYAVVPNAVRP